jgi:hypothetical protein
MPFHPDPRFRKPPCDPGRSVFPSPVLTLAYPTRAFPTPAKLTCWRTSAPFGVSLLARSSCFRSTAFFRHSVRQPSQSRTAKCPEPLCLVQVFPSPGRRPAPPRRALPLLPRSYGLMRQTLPLPPFSASALYGRSWPVLASAGGERVLPDVISASPSQHAWICTTVAGGVHLPVSSSPASAFPTKGEWVGCATALRSATSQRPLLSRSSSFLTFRPVGLLATQVAPTATLARRAAVTFTSEQNVSRYLPTHRIC